MKIAYDVHRHGNFISWHLKRKKKGSVEVKFRKIEGITNSKGWKIREQALLLQQFSDNKLNSLILETHSTEGQLKQLFSKKQDGYIWYPHNIFLCRNPIRTSANNMCAKTIKYFQELCVIKDIIQNHRF